MGDEARCGRRSTPSSRESGTSVPFAFTLDRELAEFTASTRGGPAMSLEIAHDGSGNTMQQLSVGRLKLSVSVERDNASAAMPERLFNVSRRNSLGDNEVLYATRTPSPHRKASAGRLSALLDDMAASRAQRRDVCAVERGDLSAAHQLVRQTARSCGTTPRTLIDALRGVGPPELSACLAELQC